ncbi:MAG: enoyl-CoA hydratase/isomerase family protein [Candidatus Lambdaproteobacteria bacterium]|nr:enoyl-CoA hydratase/isomerase family protein [Candidatus Lambdaproteobacteria bacterium]
MNYDFQTLQVTRSGKVLTVTMHRPEKLNAIDEVMHTELSQVFERVRQDEAAEVVVLTGAGRAFTAGGDTRWMQRMIDDAALWRKTSREGRRIVLSLLDVEKPVIAKVNGPAAGLGASMALMCDVIFASDQATIGDPHVRIGFVAGDGGAAIWPYLIGFARAKEFLFTGEMLPAQKCAEMGLINHCVPHAELDGRVQEFAERLANGPIRAISWTKMAVNAPLRALASKSMDTSINMEAMSNVSYDHQEAVRAFNEKRKPVFQGR